MTRREGYNRDIVFECDKCSDDEETHCSDFDSAWQKAKGHGWRAVKIEGEWEHRCPSCAGSR